ncbi:2,3-dihydro-2,3-dihydroxybenzoate dehydrogenase [Veronia pacifica]|uniref:2,3-dihydro-2,3-dihydroxybenzoate dehydrogenase n=1 Tax=Veronia pacifica TaxID=1080227 RepID=A0A1C3EJX5_9GAMM|nr:2,3-dihydro-2,3-dihydroxybenzoate dehydrogenase [Veronia pacifica]ODA33534.1 2,3-dihydro-2,3-dihydroxybenzoate dehydrogenase [Veronia pacifica]
MDQEFRGKRVLVAGSAKGIGLSVTSHLLLSGATVVATDVNSQLLETNTASLKNRYADDLICQTLDITQFDDVAQQVERIIDLYGDIDHLVSCAGILHIGSLADMPMNQIIDTFTVNTFGNLALMQAITPSMKKHGSGSMVIVGSNAANTPRPNMGAYSASKAALHSMVKNMGIELAEHGIRCNIISPGSTRTDMQKQLWTENYGENEVIAGNNEGFRLGVPLRKIAEPEDIARSILFLLSDAANHITMHDLRIDGGATLDN